MNNSKAKATESFYFGGGKNGILPTIKTRQSSDCCENSQ